jgi:hypothetical protein
LVIEGDFETRLKANFLSKLNLTNHSAAQERPALAASPTGYLAVWRDDRNNASSGLDIYGQFLTASGVASGTLMAITTAGNIQSNPAVAYNSQSGNYVVVWDDNRAGSDVDIYGQIVNANGTLGRANARIMLISLRL